MKYLRLTNDDRQKIKESIISLKNNKKEEWFWNAIGGEYDAILKKECKGLTSRERQVIESALAQVDNWNLCNKINTWVNDRGNHITNGFIMDVDGNQRMDKYERLLKMGYRQFYYSAPYHWGVVNPKELKMFTYTEGDTSLIVCKDKEHYIAEINDSIKFFKDSGYSGSFWDATEKQLINEV